MRQVIQFSSVQFSPSVVSDSLWPHRPQYARPPCPSPTPRVHSNSPPLTHWRYPTISSSIVPFSCLQSFPTSGSFQMRRLFTSGGQNIGVSASTSVLSMNIQDWFPLGWTSWISLLSKGWNTCKPMADSCQCMEKTTTVLKVIQFSSVQSLSRVRLFATSWTYTLHAILQARILEWVPFPFSKGSSQPRHRTQVSHIAGRFFTSWATREAQEYWSG